MSEFLYKNKFGSIKLSFDNNMMITEFTGAISISLVEYLITTSTKLLKKRSSKPWGYISCSKKAEAATPEAYNLLVEAAKNFKLCGCIKSAYVLSSPIAIAQTETLVLATGNTTPIKNLLFDELEQAKEFITNVLEDYEQSNT